MNGITILAEQQSEIFGFHNVAFWITVAICAAIFLALGIYLSVEGCFGWCGSVLFIALFIALGFLCGAMLGIVIANCVPTGYETIYEVVIDESVSMTEFLERYEIIEQRGKIFTIREIAK